MSTAFTNEELARQIQSGDTTPYEELWQRTRLLLFKLANGYYINNREHFAASGVERADVQQACFLALCDAVRMFNPDKGYSLTAYFRFAVKNQISVLLGGKGSKIRTLNTCHSIEEPVPGADDLTIADMLPDEAAQLDFEDVEQKAYNEALRTALEKGIDRLPENIGTLIRQYYLDGKTTAESAISTGVSETYVYTLRQNGLSLLRRYDRIGHGFLYAFLYDPADSNTAAYRNTGYSAFRTGGSSVERAADT